MSLLNGPTAATQAAAATGNPAITAAALAVDFVRNIPTIGSAVSTGLRAVTETLFGSPKAEPWTEAELEAVYNAGGYWAGGWEGTAGDQGGGGGFQGQTWVPVSRPVAPPPTSAPVAPPQPPAPPLTPGSSLNYAGQREPGAQEARLPSLPGGFVGGPLVPAQPEKAWAPLVRQAAPFVLPALPRLLPQLPGTLRPLGPLVPRPAPVTPAPRPLAVPETQAQPRPQPRTELDLQQKQENCCQPCCNPCKPPTAPKKPRRKPMPRIVLNLTPEDLCAMVSARKGSKK